jgi:D-Tyr-tRNAtyr deacylase
MSITASMRNEIKRDLCRLLKIPQSDDDDTIKGIVDKIISCSVIEAMVTISKIKYRGDKNEYR